MRLTLRHDGDPATAQVVDADTGEVVENVRSWTLTRPGASPFETLTVTLLLGGSRPKAKASRPAVAAGEGHGPGQWPADDAETFAGVCDRCGESRPLRRVDGILTFIGEDVGGPPELGSWCLPCLGLRLDDV